MDLEKLNEAFDKILKEFEVEVIPYLRANLKNQGYLYTSDLYNKLNTKRTNITASEWELMMSFPGYGRILEKRNPFAFNAPVDELAKWVLAKGLDKFKSIPGYENSNFIPAKAAERIAWGIKMGQRATGGRDLKDPILYSWFYRPFFGMWRDKRDRLVMAYYDHYPAEVVSELRKTYQEAVSNLAKHGGSR